MCMACMEETVHKFIAKRRSKTTDKIKNKGENENGQEETEGEKMKEDHDDVRQEEEDHDDENIDKYIDNLHILKVITEKFQSSIRRSSTLKIYVIEIYPTISSFVSFEDIDNYDYEYDKEMDGLCLQIIKNCSYDENNNNQSQKSKKEEFINFSDHVGDEDEDIVVLANDDKEVSNVDDDDNTLNNYNIRLRGNDLIDKSREFVNYERKRTKRISNRLKKMENAKKNNVYDQIDQFSIYRDEMLPLLKLKAKLTKFRIEMGMYE